MFNRTESTTPGLDEIITALESQLVATDPDAEEYAKMVTQLETLYKIKAQTKPPRVSADTLVIAGANLLGIILIVGHERAHVMTSKAVGFVLKAR